MSEYLLEGKQYHEGGDFTYPDQTRGKLLYRDGEHGAIDFHTVRETELVEGVVDSVSLRLEEAVTVNVVYEIAKRL